MAFIQQLWNTEILFCDHTSSLPTLPTESSKLQTVCWLSCHTQPLPLSQPISSQRSSLLVIPSLSQRWFISLLSSWIFDSSNHAPVPAHKYGPAPPSTDESAQPLTLLTGSIEILDSNQTLFLASWKSFINLFLSPYCICLDQFCPIEI